METVDVKGLKAFITNFFEWNNENVAKSVSLGFISPVKLMSFCTKSKLWAVGRMSHRYFTVLGPDFFVSGYVC